MRIVNYKKFIRSICVLIFLISIIFAKSTFSHEEVKYTTFYVAQGDTLWNIAENLQNSNKYYKNKDVRDIIANIKSINNLESSNLYVNQTLKIPTI